MASEVTEAKEVTYIFKELLTLHLESEMRLTSMASEVTEANKVSKKTVKS